MRNQVANLIRSSIALPLEIGQLARDRLQSAEKVATATEVDRLRARVEELEAEMAILREVLTSDIPMSRWCVTSGDRYGCRSQTRERAGYGAHMV